EVTVQSAGIFAPVGGSANPLTKAVLQEQEIESDHQSQPVTDALLDWSDLVLTMTMSHQAHIQMDFPAYAHKVHALLHYVADISEDVMDPYGGTMADYEETYHRLDEAIKQLMNKLQNEGVL